MPIYNVRDYIEDCIRSIINQNLEHYEIICIEDCSVDGTREMVDELKVKYPITVIYNAENRGVCYSRNEGIYHSRGRYIWFIDPDDLLVPGIARQYLKKAIEQGADFVIGNYRKIPETFSILEDNKNIQCSFKMCDYSFEIPSDEHGIGMNAIWAGPLKREFLLRNKLFFREGLIAQEDTLFYYEMKQNDMRVLKTEKIGYLYRQRESSIMHMCSDEKNINYYKSMIAMFSVYHEKLESEKYRNRKELCQRIHHTQENITWTLAMIKDEKYVHEEFEQLNISGIYPYRLRWHLLKTSRPMKLKIMMFLLPIKPFFWLVHKLLVVRQN